MGGMSTNRGPEPGGSRLPSTHPPLWGVLERGGDGRWFRAHGTLLGPETTGAPATCLQVAHPLAGGAGFLVFWPPAHGLGHTRNDPFFWGVGVWWWV